jgi:hypothetical protein
MVGPCGLEPQTSSVSGKRSNQLSYGPTVAESISWADQILPHSSPGAQFGSHGFRCHDSVKYLPLYFPTMCRSQEPSSSRCPVRSRRSAVESLSAIAATIRVQVQRSQESLFNRSAKVRQGNLVAAAARAKTPVCRADRLHDEFLLLLLVSPSAHSPRLERVALCGEPRERRF